MDLRQLRYFLQIAESGSLSKAADQLRIAQPSLSSQLRGLEDELGVELLVRHSRGVTPTDLGKLLCDHARAILGDIERAKEIVQSRSKDPVGRVSVGLPTSACRGLSLRLFKAVAERHPGISLHLVEAMTGNLDEWLQIGRLDVALLYNHKAFENVAWTEMMVEDLSLLVSAKAPLANTGKISFTDLAKLPIAVPGRPHVLRSVIESCAAGAGVKLENAIDCDSLTGYSTARSRPLLHDPARVRTGRRNRARRHPAARHNRSNAIVAAVSRALEAHDQQPRQRGCGAGHGVRNKRDGPVGLVEGAAEAIAPAEQGRENKTGECPCGFFRLISLRKAHSVLSAIASSSPWRAPLLTSRDSCGRSGRSCPGADWLAAFISLERKAKRLRISRCIVRVSSTGAASVTSGRSSSRSTTLCPRSRAHPSRRAVRRAPHRRREARNERRACTMARWVPDASRAGFASSSSRSPRWPHPR